MITYEHNKQIKSSVNTHKSKTTAGKVQLFLYKQKQENKERYPVFKILVIQGKMFDLVVES